MMCLTTSHSAGILLHVIAFCDRNCSLSVSSVCLVDGSAYNKRVEQLVKALGGVLP